VRLLLFLLLLLALQTPWRRSDRAAAAYRR